MNPERNDYAPGDIEILGDELEALESAINHDRRVIDEKHNALMARVARLEGLVLLIAERQGTDVNGPAAKRAMHSVRS